MSMYNKLFTKILDSSVWMEPTPTRIVWMTFIAAMDEDGFVQFASEANVAHRARVSLDEARAAVACLEGPDENSSDPENEGRRIERVAGGWMVLNSKKYRVLVTRAIIKEQTRARVARHRERKCNANVTHEKREANDSLTPSVSGALSDSGAKTSVPLEPPPAKRSGKGITEGKDSDNIPSTPQSVRIAKLFRRRLTTPWQDNEIAAYRKLGTIPEEDLAAVEAYYGANWPPKTGVNILRQDMLTLLNNFQGEVGRAKIANSKKSNWQPAAGYVAPPI